MTKEYTEEEIIKFGELVEIKKNAWVKEGAEIIFLEDELKEMELKLLRAIFSQITEGNKQNNIVKMKISDLIAFCHFDKTHGYTRVFEISRGLREHSIAFYDLKNPKKLVDTGWILKIVYEKIKNEIYVNYVIDPDLMPYIGKVEGQFVGYEVQNSMILKGRYTIRIYEICAFFKNSDEKCWFVTIEKLKTIFCLNGKKGYDSPANIKQRIISPAIKQINEKTDLDVKVEYIKKGRNVIAIKFNIDKKKKKTKKEKEQQELPAALPAPDPKPEELSPEKKKDAENLHEIGVEPPKWTEEQMEAFGALAYYDIFPLQGSSEKMEKIRGYVADGNIDRITKNISHVLLVERPSKDKISGAIINAIIEDREAAYRAAREKKKEEEWKEKERKDREYEEKKKNLKGFDLDKLPKEMQESDFAKILMKRKESETP